MNDAKSFTRRGRSQEKTPSSGAERKLKVEALRMILEMTLKRLGDTVAGDGADGVPRDEPPVAAGVHAGATDGRRLATGSDREEAHPKGDMEVAA